MCTGLEIAAIAGTVISGGAAIYSGVQQNKMADAAANQANADALAAAGEAEVMASKIRKAGKQQQASAVAALAASGVDVQVGTAEQIQTDIAQRTEEDALTTILNGKDSGRRLNRIAAADRIGGSNAMTAGYLNAGSTVLSSVAAQQRTTNWKGRSYGSTLDGFYTGTGRSGD